jgi:hypothetical protein
MTVVSEKDAAGIFLQPPELLTVLLNIPLSLFIDY